MLNVLAIVLPVIAMLALGKFLGVKKIIDDRVVNGIKAIISNIMLPVTLFDALAMTVFNGKDMLLVGAVFLSFTLILVAAILLRPLFGKYRDYAPFLCASMEGGMLCYSLYMNIYGSDSLGTLLRVDLANILFAFTVFLFAIKSVGQKKGDTKSSVLGFAKNPVVIAIALGIIISVTSLGQMLAKSAIFGVYKALINIITAPLGALVLITVGFGLKFDKETLAAVAKVSAVRLVLSGIALVVIILLFRSYWAEKALLVALVLEFFMPGQFITPIYIEDDEQRRFASTQLSFYTIISIIAYILIIGFMPLS